MFVQALLAQSMAVHASGMRILLLILVLIAIILLLAGMAIALLTWRNMHKNI